MQFTSIAVSAVAGIVIGFLLAYFKQKQRVDELEEALGEAQNETSYFKKDLTARLEEERAATLKAEQEANKAKEALEQLNKRWEGLTPEQVEALQSRVEAAEGELATAREEAEAQKAAHDEAEKRFEQAQTLANEAQEKVERLEQELSTMEHDAEELQQALEQSEQDLAEQRARPAAAASSRGEQGLKEIFKGAEGSLNKVLQVLVDEEEQQVAVLADSNGIVVAASGDKNLKDGLAAAAQITGRFTLQLEGMVPFDELQAFVLQDRRANVFAGRTFDVMEEHVVLAAYGPRPPEASVLVRAEEHLKDALA